MAAEAHEASSNTDAPEQKNSTATSAGRTQRAKKQPRQSLTERVKSIRPLELLPGLLLAAAVMALYTYYSLQQGRHRAGSGEEDLQDDPRRGPQGREGEHPGR